MAGDSYTFELDAEDNASKPIDDLQEEIDQLGDGSEATDEQVGTLARSVEALADDFETARGEVDRLERQVDQLESELDDARSSTTSMGEVMGGALGAEAVMALGDAAVEAGGRIADMAIQISDSVGTMTRMAEASGVAEREYQKLSFAMRKIGGDSEMLKDALGTVSERAVDARMGAVGMREDFSALGITVDQLRNKTPGELFRLVAKRIRNTESDTKALKGAVALLGDEVGNKLVGRIRSGEQGLQALRNQAEETNVVLGAEQVDALERSDNAIERAQSSWKGLKRQITADMANDVAALADESARLAQELANAESSGDGFFESVTEQATGLVKVARDLQDAGGGDGKGPVQQFLDSIRPEGVEPINLNPIVDSLEESGEVAEAFKSRLNDVSTSIRGRTGFSGSISTVIQDNERFQASLEDARDAAEKYGAGSRAAKDELADLEAQLVSYLGKARDATDATRDASDGNAELIADLEKMEGKSVDDIVASGDSGAGTPAADGPQLTEEQRQAKENLLDVEKKISDLKTRILQSESEKRKAMLRSQKKALEAERVRLRARKRGASEAETELARERAKRMEIRAQNRLKRRQAEIAAQESKKPLSLGGAGVPERSVE
jgi:chromosome segregation ATPase